METPPFGILAPRELFPLPYKGMGQQTAAVYYWEKCKSMKKKQPYGGGCEGMSESCDGTKIPRKASGALSPALKHEARVAHLQEMKHMVSER